VLEVDYRCVASSSTVYTITMPQGAIGDNTYLVDDAAHIIDPEGGPSKTLTLRCFGTATPPSPTETPLPTVTATPTPTPTSTPPVTPTPTGLVGDANKDGQVNPIDAVIVLQYSAGLISSINPNADANHDGRINAIDAALVLQYAAGLLGQL